MVLWLRVHLAIQETQVQSLVREGPTCHRTTKPVPPTTEPVPGTWELQLLKPKRPEPMPRDKRSPCSGKPSPQRAEAAHSGEAPTANTNQATVSMQRCPSGSLWLQLAQRAVPGLPCPRAAPGSAGLPRPSHALCTWRLGHRVLPVFLPLLPPSLLCAGGGGQGDRPGPPFTPSSGGLAWSREIPSTC